MNNTYTEQIRWMREFFATRKLLSLIGDDEAVTYVSTGAVILAAAVTGNRTPHTIARFTGFPLEFAVGVLADMDQSAMWEDESYAGLARRLKEMPDNLDQVEGALCSVLESFWHAACIPLECLSMLRQGVAFGAGQQSTSPEIVPGLPADVV